MNNNGSQFKQKLTTPSKYALCILLAGGDHKAGAFLSSILHWAKYGKAEIPGVEGVWVANLREWWMRECCLTSSQYDRTISRLDKRGLVQRRQWWFAGRNILYLRPTKIALDYIASATTWKAAEQFLPPPADKDDFNKCEYLSSVDLAISNGGSLSDEPGSAEKPISKPLSNLSSNQTFDHQCAAPASPACAGANFLKKSKKKIPGKTKKVTDVKFEVDLHKLASAWNSMLADKYPEEHKVGKLSPKELGGLALVESTFAKMTRELSIDPVEYELSFGTFLASVINQWPTVKCHEKPAYPDLNFLAEEFGAFAQGWLDAETAKGCASL